MRKLGIPVCPRLKATIDLAPRGRYNVGFSRGPPCEEKITKNSCGPLKSGNRKRGMLDPHSYPLPVGVGLAR
jgi:hypothetical protein